MKARTIIMIYILFSIIACKANKPAIIDYSKDINTEFTSVAKTVGEAQKEVDALVKSIEDIEAKVVSETIEYLPGDLSKVIKTTTTTKTYTINKSSEADIGIKENMVENTETITNEQANYNEKANIVNNKATKHKRKWVWIMSLCLVSISLLTLYIIYRGIKHKIKVNGGL